MSRYKIMEQWSSHLFLMTYKSQCQRISDLSELSDIPFLSDSFPHTQSFFPSSHVDNADLMCATWDGTSELGHLNRVV